MEGDSHYPQTINESQINSVPKEGVKILSENGIYSTIPPPLSPPKAIDVNYQMSSGASLGNNPMNMNLLPTMVPHGNYVSMTSPQAVDRNHSQPQVPHNVDRQSKTGTGRKKANDRKDVPLTDSQKQFIRSKFVRQGYCKNVCTYCSSTVHNDHVARWASHFRACSKIPPEDRAEYDSYAEYDFESGNRKRKIDDGSSSSMDLLFRAAVASDEGEGKRAESMHTEEEMLVNINEAFKEGVESGIILLDKFSEHLVDKARAADISNEIDTSELLQNLKKELMSNFLLHITRNRGNFEDYDASKSIEDMVHKM